MTMSAFPDESDDVPSDLPDELQHQPDFPFLLTPSLYRRVYTLLQESDEALLDGSQLLTDFHRDTRWGLLAISLPQVPLVIGLLLGPQHRGWLERIPQYAWTLSFNTAPAKEWGTCLVHVPSASIEPLLASFLADPRPADDFDLMADGLLSLRQRLEQHHPHVSVSLLGFHRTPLMQRVERSGLSGPFPDSI